VRLGVGVFFSHHSAGGTIVLDQHPMMSAFANVLHLASAIASVGPSQMRVYLTIDGLMMSGAAVRMSIPGENLCPPVANRFCVPIGSPVVALRTVRIRLFLSS
jgi:hypothetical protein